MSILLCALAESEQITILFLAQSLQTKRELPALPSSRRQNQAVLSPEPLGVVHSAPMVIQVRQDSPSVTRWTPVRNRERGAKFVQLAQLKKLRRCQQVAAICYRLGSTGIEFLLVQTDKEKWTFPKGSAEPGLTHAQAAALEAFEEAGVHGRMEEAPFTRYVRPGERRNSASEFAVSAHLCEVLRRVPPQEADRNPSWFSTESAKRRLREGRSVEYGGELARVVDRAVARIRRVKGTDRVVIAPDKVRFIDQAAAASNRPKSPEMG